jgi:hypothetical protein
MREGQQRVREEHKDKDHIAVLLEGRETFEPRVGLRYKNFVFVKGIKRGDCTIAPGASFLLYEDGSTHWNCYISSSDTGDEWSGTMVILDAAKRGIIGMEPDYEFDISDKDQWKHWVLPLGPEKAILVSPNIAPTIAIAYAQAAYLGFECSC